MADEEFEDKLVSLLDADNILPLHAVDELGTLVALPSISVRKPCGNLLT